MRKFRRWRLFLWSLFASFVLHALFMWLAGPLWLNRFAAHEKQQQAVVTTISTAVRIDRRMQPERAAHPVVPQPQHALPQPQHVAAAAPHAAVVPPHITRTRSVTPPQPHVLTQADLDAQTRQYERTIAKAKAANNPLAGIANAAVKPESPKRYTFNIASEVGSPLPNGLLVAIDSWHRGGYTYYHVHYDVEYADGEQESGDVPWPIRYPPGADPFAQGIHTMPLPGPPADWSPPAGTQLAPLLKNCYDHRYTYCPIAYEGE